MLYLQLADCWEMTVIVSCKGNKKEDLLTMMLYEISLLPMICQLKNEILDIFKPWYANDRAGM